MQITYFAIFHHDEDSLWVNFPDLPGCFSCGKNNEHAQKMAKDALSLYLHNMMIEQLPTPTALSEFYVLKTQNVLPITVDLEIRDGKIFYQNVT